MEFDFDSDQEYAGALLVSHPSLRADPFHKSVVLISAHSDEEGALGVIINRPAGKMLGQYDECYRYGPLANVPVYEGGPVHPEQMLLAALLWQPDEHLFRLYFGISEVKAAELLEEEPEVKIRAFMGYAGWSAGQLESEHDGNAWLVTPMANPEILNLDGPVLWRELITQLQPDLLFLANAPEDPSLN